MSYGNRDDNRHPDPWKTALHEARNSAEEAASYIPSDVPADSVLHATREQIAAHTYTFKYYSRLEPFTEVFEADWEETLYQRFLPPSSGAVHLESGMFGDFDAAGAVHELDWIRHEVSLSNLRTLFKEGNETHFDIYVDGEHRERRRMVYHLSPRGISICLNKLDSCLKQMGWMPEPGEGEIRGQEAVSP